MLAHHAIDLVLDVGANVGQYGAELRSFGYAGRLVSFEPLPGAVACLNSRAANDPLWQTRQCAIGDRRATVDLNVAGNDGASSSILPMLDRHNKAAPQAAYVDSVAVEQFRLDDLAADYVSPGDRVLLKIDVQGYESSVLAGAPDLLNTITGIQVELSLVPLYEGATLYQQMLTTLTGLGFRLEWLGSGFGDPATGQMLQMDGLFFRAAEI